MQLVTAFSEQDETDVNYEDFLHLVGRNGELDGLENQYRNLAAEKQATPGGRPSERGMRDVIDRIKSGVGQAAGGVHGVEQALRKVGSNGGVAVSQDDLIIGLSRANA
jgi:hypothetical protein